MYDEADIRDKLIDSCHSSKEAEQFFMTRLGDKELLALLMKIAEDSDDYGGDAPMQAAHFAAQYSGTLLAPYEPTLFRLLTTVNGYGGHIGDSRTRYKVSLPALV